MAVHKIPCYRFYSDLSGFDFVVIFEQGEVEKPEALIDGIIETWFEGEEDVYFIPLIEYVQLELENKGFLVSIYSCVNSEEE